MRELFFYSCILFVSSAFAWPLELDLSKQWGLDFSSVNGGANVVKAWSVAKNNYKVRVAFIELGSVDAHHEDLKNMIYINKDEIPANGKDDDKNGYIDDYAGYNASTKIGFDLSDAESKGASHTTHTAGIVAAEHNGIGIAGIATNIEILNISAEWRGNKERWREDMANAITYAVKNGVDIINISARSLGHSEDLEQAVELARQNDVIIVASAGNQGVYGAVYPAAYSAKFNNVISVASSKKERVRSYFSNYGVDKVDIFAPGDNIYSTLPNSSYGSRSGTSMAAPFVTGAIALVLSTDGPSSAAEMKERIIGTSKRFETLSGIVYSNGLLDAYSALTGQLSFNFIWK